MCFNIEFKTGSELRLHDVQRHLVPCFSKKNGFRDLGAKEERDPPAYQPTVRKPVPIQASFFSLKKLHISAIQC